MDGKGGWWWKLRFGLQRVHPQLKISAATPNQGLGVFPLCLKFEAQPPFQSMELELKPPKNPQISSSVSQRGPDRHWGLPLPPKLGCNFWGLLIQFLGVVNPSSYSLWKPLAITRGERWYPQDKYMVDGCQPWKIFDSVNKELCLKIKIRELLDSNIVSNLRLTLLGSRPENLGLKDGLRANLPIVNARTNELISQQKFKTSCYEIKRVISTTPKRHAMCADCHAVTSLFECKNRFITEQHTIISSPFGVVINTKNYIMQNTFPQSDTHMFFSISLQKKNILNCLQLTFSVLQLSCHPNSTLCTVTLHQSLLSKFFCSCIIIIFKNHVITPINYRALKNNSQDLVKRLPQSSRNQFWEFTCIVGPILLLVVHINFGWELPRRQKFSREKIKSKQNKQERNKRDKNKKKIRLLQQSLIIFVFIWIQFGQ
ncbi:hypothetical protein VP01_4885g1 [Puccinia sorghi]|uniref:Uncharacterized protein n=1 Tax=Puccinia sorghi TaxID=27349 RepID=A0A0L6UP72_9BASI|nr:hypothetical protein VP01_4885g1 [Puccinia sorghi]